MSALGNQRPTDAIIDLLVKKTDDTGWASRVRQAAVGALADAKDKRGIEPAKKLAAYGGPFRARGTGIAALGSLYEVADDAGKTDIRESLVAIINDPQQPPRDVSPFARWPRPATRRPIPAWSASPPAAPPTP